MSDSPTTPPSSDPLALAAHLGDLLAKHPATSKYKDAQRAVSADPEAGRLLGEFEKELMTLSRLEQQGMPPSDAQQQKLQQLQSRIVSNLRIKALNIAEVDFYDLLRKVNQTMLKPINAAAQGTPPTAGNPTPAGPRILGM